ncbi:MAG: DsrE family protein [Deltaproteobacteria bacterium]|nr:DsrE family protein [Deltaproteobacteria bacterium]MBW2100457.1 DsrE family protein [Deltaproteobacteria bacterium]
MFVLIDRLHAFCATRRTKQKKGFYMFNYAQRKTLSILIGLLCLLSLQTPSFAAQANNKDALAELNAAKSIFDINLAQIEKLPLYLKVIRMTYENIAAEGLSPDFVVAFRGPSVRFIITPEPATEKKALKNQIAKQIKDLKSLGVRFEACAIALDLFRLDPTTVLPEIKVVGNTFMSLIGYQAKGYSAIPIM